MGISQIREGSNFFGPISYLSYPIKCMRRFKVLPRIPSPTQALEVIRRPNDHLVLTTELVFWDGIYETADGDSFADRTLLKYEDDDKDNLADKRGQIWCVLFCPSPAMF